jgi:[protein-PII] uridylyltransferase
MPSSYRQRFKPVDVQRHAQIAALRGTRASHVDVFFSSPEVSGLCVVADDRPGLLWLISAALFAEELDVTKAHIYCRRRADGRTEAVDFIRVRRAPWSARRGPLGSEDVSRLGERLEGLVSFRERAHGRCTPPRPNAEPPAATDPARVTFVVDAETGSAMLAIEAPDRVGLLLEIAHALFQEDVQIVRAEVATIGSRALDTFYVLELDGAPISVKRRAQIENAAHTALSRVDLGLRSG